MLARATNLGHVCGAANQPHGPRARRELRDLEVRGPSNRIDNNIPARRAVRWELPQRPTRIVGRGRHADPDPRSSTGSPFKELPLLVQRPGADPPTRSSDRRHHCGWSWQPQRPGALPRLDPRNPLQAAWSRPGRRCLPGHPRAHHTGVSRKPDAARPRLASASSTSRQGRTRHGSSQELACSTRLSPSRLSPRRYPPGYRLPSQSPPGRITGQPLVLPGRFFLSSDRDRDLPL